MVGVETPSKLRDFCTNHNDKGGVGVLVSGGSNQYGKVPLEKFYKTLSWVKENTDLIVNIHTGLLDFKQAEDIASTGVDVVSVDIVGSDITIKRVYGLDATVDDYVHTLRVLKEACVPQIVPHICVGLDFGKIRGEARALELLSEIDPNIIVILGLIPTKDTPMEFSKPPSSEDLAKVIAATRLTYPDSSVALGCMWPRINKHGAEMLAIKAGADRLVLPSSTTVRMTVTEDFDVLYFDGCCAIPESLEHLALKKKSYINR
jgi:uncharacterized radical SAM superfamily protein